MMAIQANPEAVKLADDLVMSGNFRINTSWREVKPSETAVARFAEDHGDEQLARWYLAVNTDANGDSSARLLYPIGDFKSVHRSGLVAAKQDAEKHGYTDVAAAADEILDLFDRITAC